MPSADELFAAAQAMPRHRALTCMRLGLEVNATAESNVNVDDILADAPTGPDGSEVK